MADVPIRASTIKLMELADECILTWEQIGRACLVYMSEDDVSDMARENELFWAEVEDGDEEVEGAARALVRLLEGLLGESLNDYLTQ